MNKYDFYIILSYKVWDLTAQGFYSDRNPYASGTIKELLSKVQPLINRTSEIMGNAGTSEAEIEIISPSEGKASVTIKEGDFVLIAMSEKQYRIIKPQAGTFHYKNTIVKSSLSNIIQYITTQL